MTRYHKKIAMILAITTTLTMSISACDNNKEISAEKQTDSELLLHVPSPDWRDQIIYFLMIDRFNDGDKTNNDMGAGEYDPTKESHFSGGDIPGIIDKLDYIENLGATSLWITPPVANQWWSEGGQYGGYHGYWATNFSEVDKHFGDIDSYKTLSDQLHRKDMYLIQDIVVNHTGNFFNYSGKYNPENTAENFILLESDNEYQHAPTQSPFDLIDRLNPEHVQADIYHWTPSITDYNKDDQYRYQLAMLADINTENPVVIDKMKRIYGDWIKDVGVDAFRIDTVRYVDHAFFHHFMHDSDGVLASAKDSGRDNFLAFGEIFDTSKPFENDAEKRVASYLGDESTPMLNSVIGFPLYFDLNTVFGQGKPTSHLAYRLQQHLDIYQDPSVIPNFIDNHDTTRFLSAGNIEGLKQALTTIFTIPGIPIIYQGTEQAMVETRQAMFAGGFEAEHDSFDQQSEMYQYISRLAKLRTSDKIFTRGKMEIMASSDSGPGALVYKRTYQDRTVLIIFNSAEHSVLLSQVDLGSVINPSMKSLFTENISADFIDNDIAIVKGKLTTSLPAKGVFIAEIIENETSVKSTSTASITIEDNVTNKILTRDTLLTGRSNQFNQTILIVENDNLDKAVKVQTDDVGNWQYTYPVRNLGKNTIKIQAYSPQSKAVSNITDLNVFVETAELEISVSDPVNDDHGRNGKYQAPTQSNSNGQMDIVNAKAAIAGDVMRLTLTMRSVTDAWKPSNGFDNVAVNVFFDSVDKDGLTLMPNLQGHLPESLQWNAAHYGYGWGNFSFSTENSTATHVGHKFSVAPTILADSSNNTITFIYRASELNIEKWLGTKVYISTWDKSGEGVFRDINLDGSEWIFGGASADSVRVLDDIIFTVE